MILDQPVRLPAKAVEARRTSQGLEQQRAARARRGDDEDRSLQRAGPGPGCDLLGDQVLQHALIQHQRRAGAVGPHDEAAGECPGRLAHSRGQAQKLHPSLPAHAVQGAQLTPVEHKALQQSRESLDVSSIRRGHELAAQVVDQPLHLGGGHDRRALVVLGQQPRLGARLPAHRPPLLARRRRAAGELPERRRAGRVGDQMDARLAGLVFHMMPTPVVEDPGLARGHVDGLTIAMEAHLRLGEDRDVQPHPRVPVVVDVGVLGHGRPWRQAHQPRSAPHHAEAGQHLLQVRHAREPARRQHLSVYGVTLATISANQPGGAVARDLVRVRDPGLSRQRRDLGLQAGDVEQHGELEEGSRQPHRIRSCTRSRRHPTPCAAAPAKAHSVPTG